MGRGVLINKDKNKKSGPIELIVGGALQPGYEKYINAPSTSASAMNGSNTSRWATGASTDWPWGGGTDANPLFGHMQSTLRINFTDKCVGKTCTITWYGKASARFDCYVHTYTTGGTLYYKNSPNDMRRTDTFIITQKNFYFIIVGNWDGETTVWSPSTEASVSYLAIE